MDADTPSVCDRCRAARKWGRIRPTLYLSMGLMGLVLLIACVSVANLMVARAERIAATAIHVALGASSRRALVTGC